MQLRNKNKNKNNNNYYYYYIYPSPHHAGICTKQRLDYNLGCRWSRVKVNQYPLIMKLGGPQIQAGNYREEKNI